jgi:alpha-glucosidase (family GH31 glycosyl hydrolase)
MLRGKMALGKRLPALACLIVSLIISTERPAVAGPRADLQRVEDGIVIAVGDAFLKIEVLANNIARIVYSKDRSFLDHKSFVTEPMQRRPVRFRVSESSGEATLSTDKMKVRVDTRTGRVSFLDVAGKPIAVERRGGRGVTPAEVQGEQTFHIRQEWEPNVDEALYGLGQHQLGLVDIKGYDLDLWQHNGTVAVPFLVSSRGYGLLWDNASFTRFGDLREFEPIPAGRRYRLRLEWTKDQGMETVRLQWKPPAPLAATSLWSEVGKGIDYYFIYGPDPDEVVAGYRHLTGQAPMMPLWAFGLWQSRQRYNTAQESLDVLEGFHRRGIPIDNIVQDWFYCKEEAWGSHQFDPSRFPDPQGWISAIHDKYHAQMIISVWPKFYPGTRNFDELHSRGFLYEPSLREGIHDWIGHPDTFYDAFSPEARRLFWSQIERELFKERRGRLVAGCQRAGPDSDADA